MLAQGTGGFASGDVTLNATSNEVFTFVLGQSDFQTRNASSSVAIGQATIEGRDVKVQAQSQTGKTVPDSATPPPAPVGFVLGVIQAAVAPADARVVLSQSQASISLAAGALISAARDVTITSAAASAAQMSSSLQLVGITYGDSEPTATVTLSGTQGATSGASISAAGMFTIGASTTNTLNLVVSVPTTAPVNASLAYGRARSTSTVTSRQGPRSRGLAGRSPRATPIVCRREAIAAGFGASGGAGVGGAIAIGDYGSSASTVIDGHLTSTGPASVTLGASTLDIPAETHAFGLGCVPGARAPPSTRNFRTISPHSA